MILGVDIGGTKTQAVAFRDDGAVLATVDRPTATGPAGIVHTVREAVADLRSTIGSSATMPAVVGVDVPGLVSEEGTVSRAVNLGVESMALRAELERELGVGVVVENDVKASALGAAAYLDARRSSLTFLNFGTGVASATVVRGELLRGVTNAAGEIGHLPVDPAGKVCPCGQRGCLELQAGGAAIQRELRALPTPCTLDALFAAPDDDARRDPGPRAAQSREVRALRARITAAVTFAITTSVVMYDSELIVLSGGVLRHAPPLLPAVEAELRERAAVSPFLAELDVPARLRTLPPSWPVAAAGAALVGARAASVRTPA